MLGPRTIKVNGKRKVLRRREFRQRFFQLDRIRAQVHVLLPRHEALYDLVDLRMQQRFATGDRNDRRPTFVGRAKALLGRQLPPQGFRWMLNLPATGAGQIAPHQRLQHED